MYKNTFPDFSNYSTPIWLDDKTADAMFDSGIFRRHIKGALRVLLREKMKMSMLEILDADTKLDEVLCYYSAEELGNYGKADFDVRLTPSQNCPQPKMDSAKLYMDDAAFFDEPFKEPEDEPGTKTEEKKNPFDESSDFGDDDDFDFGVDDTDDGDDGSAS